MALYTIDCQRYILNGTQKSLGAEKTVETDNGEIHATFVIKCDGKDDVYSFKTEYYGDGDIEAEVDRCNVNVHIPVNLTPYDRHYTLTFTHSNDVDVFITVTLTQKADDFKVEITEGASIDQSTGKYEKTLESEVSTPFGGLDGNRYNYFEKAVFHIRVTGGSRRYRIGSIVRCHDEDDGTRYMPFDGGFIVNRTTDSLEVINYGRPFMDGSDYYIIRLLHDDYREAFAELVLRYGSIQGRSLQKTSAARKTGKKAANYQRSDVYLPYSVLSAPDVLPDSGYSHDEDVYEVSVGGLDDGILTIVNDVKCTNIPFSVMRGGESAALAVTARSSADWCSVKTDLAGRTLSVMIYGRPVADRMSYVKVSIVDKPGVYAEFYVRNVKR